jgi:endonuclease-3 related protein
VAGWAVVRETVREPLPSLADVYRRLLRAFGHRDWWPGDTPLEIAVGAILTQNTSWTNVEKAIANLKDARCLSVRGLREAPVGRLASLIRPSGYFRQKAKKLKAFIRFLDGNFGGSMARMRRADPAILRHELLEIWGIGPETADSILCYALEKPVFVVDAYMRRIFSRHFYVRPAATYHEIQTYVTERIPRDAALYNDFHAQIVHLGKHYCNSKPRCAGCPLEAYPHR